MLALYDHEEAVTDEPTTPSIKKMDALDPEKAVAGAKFHVWDDEGAFDEEMATDENGVAIPRLRSAEPTTSRSEAPEGYVIAGLRQRELTDRDQVFVVNDQGMIRWDETGRHGHLTRVTIENMPRKRGHSDRLRERDARGPGAR